MTRYPTSLTIKLEKAGYAFRFEARSGMTRCYITEIDRPRHVVLYVDGNDELSALRMAVDAVDSRPAEVDPRDAKIAELEAKIAAAAAEPEPEPETESEPRPRNRRATKRQADAASNDED